MDMDGREKRSGEKVREERKAEWESNVMQMLEEAFEARLQEEWEEFEMEHEAKMEKRDEIKLEIVEVRQEGDKNKEKLHQTEYDLNERNKELENWEQELADALYTLEIESDGHCKTEEAMKDLQSEFELFDTYGLHVGFFINYIIDLFKQGVFQLKDLLKGNKDFKELIENVQPLSYTDFPCSTPRAIGIALLEYKPDDIVTGRLLESLKKAFTRVFGATPEQVKDDRSAHYDGQCFLSNVDRPIRLNPDRRQSC